MSLGDWRLGLANAALSASTDFYVFSITNDRVTMGYHRAPPSIPTLIGDGPFLNVRAGGRTAIDQINRTATYKIPVDLWIGIERPSPDSLTFIEQFVEEICAAWEQVGYVMPTFDPPEIQDHNQPVIVHYEFSVEIIAPWCPGAQGTIQ